jgi:hypothetical protein
MPKYKVITRQIKASSHATIECGMTVPLVWAQGILRKGYGVASGPSPDYPFGALERQVPFFRARGLDLEGLFLGTLNIDIRPLVFEMRRPEFAFRDVLWTDLHPPEHFSFSRCRVAYAEAEFEGWLYYPHPETKLRHFQDASLMEVIAPFIPGLAIGDALRIGVDPDRVVLHRAGDVQDADEA